MFQPTTKMAYESFSSYSFQAQMPAVSGSRFSGAYENKQRPVYRPEQNLHNVKATEALMKTSRKRRRDEDEDDEPEERVAWRKCARVGDGLRDSDYTREEEEALNLPKYVKLEGILFSIQVDNPAYLKLSTHKKVERIEYALRYTDYLLRQLYKNASHCQRSRTLLTLLQRNSYRIGSEGIANFIDDGKVYESHMRLPGGTRENFAQRDDEISRRRRIVAELCIFPWGMKGKKKQ